MPTSRMISQIGRVVGGRYRLLTPLGTGASAGVFLADDVTLRRRVAIKVLHAALASDDAFLQRFRAEARTVAALRHPNIMTVYDWGEDSDGPFLVFEYLGGGSLRDVLDRGYRLTLSQALLVGLDTARALDYAHRRGLVHRDIKPANLLFDEEGRLCVADFGIARALAEAAWTEPAGAVVGTARYASPEQARGQSIDGRADVYALGLVLVEAVTGRVPFAADTTIATLMGRLDGPIPVPEALGPLGPALAGAGALDPAARSDAAALARALDQAARELPAPEPLPLAPPDRAQPGAVDRDPTQLPDGPTVLPPRPAPSQGQPAAPAVPAVIPGPAPRRRWARWRRIVVPVVLGAIVASGAAVAAVRALTPRYPVPAVTAATLAALDTSPLPHHFRVHLRHVRRDGTAPGQVLAQDPAPGVHRVDGSAITVVVSDGPTLVRVPDLGGLDQAAASTRIVQAGLAVGTVDQPYRDDVPKGTVISWSPVGTFLPKGSSVNLVVSGGPRPVTLPDVSGDTYTDAKAILDGLGLPSTEVLVYSDTVPNNAVVSTTPGPGPVPPGTAITVNVSQGPQIVTVPDVTGDTIAQASQALAAVGLQVGSIYGPPKADRVLATSPAPHSRIAHGRTVDLYTGR